jgi:hypothetical protein
VQAVEGTERTPGAPQDAWANVVPDVG